MAKCPINIGLSQHYSITPRITVSGISTKVGLVRNRVIFHPGSIRRNNDRKEIGYFGDHSLPDELQEQITNLLGPNTNNCWHLLPQAAENAGVARRRFLDVCPGVPYYGHEQRRRNRLALNRSGRTAKMTRKAILISGGDDPKIGAETDIHRYRRFLSSKIGGAWNDDGVEIEAFINPTNLQLVAPYMDAADADYAIVIYSGHGVHPAYSENPLLTRLQIADGDLRVRDLNPRNGKTLIIIDACRRYAMLAAPIVEFLTENTRIAGRVPSRNDYRDFFDDFVDGCPEQVTYLFACSLDEFSYGNKTHGGLYSRLLYSTAVDWEKKQESPNTVLNVFHAHNWTRFRVVATHTPTPQNPELLRAAGTGQHLPWCIQL